MAIRPDYDIGTVTLVASSANFTTTGASLQTAAVQAGDAIITPSGHVLIIASITGQNGGTLFLPCPAGAAGTNLPLRIRFQPDGSRYQGAVRNLVDLLSSGNVEAFAALTGAAGKVPVFTGPGAMDLQDYIADPNGTLAKFAALTLAANKALTTDGSGNAQQIDLGTLGRTLLALASGNTAQYVQGDGTLQAKAGLPVSTATQTALNGKLNLSGGNLTGVLGTNSDVLMTGLTVASGVETGRILQVGRSGSNFASSYFELRPGVAVNYVIRVTGGDGSITNWFVFNANGGLAVPGAFTAGSKSFKIDHPKDPYNKYLVYMSTEAPKAGIEDWGSIRLVNGKAEVDLDIAAGQMHGTFASLTQKAIVVSVNNLDGDTRLRAGRIVDGKFTIHAIDNPDCDDEVTWHVKAERADPFIKSHPYCDPETGLLIPEHEKED
ncbi:hypothetical protein IAE29_03100 [Ochrobactrum sp. S46]|nr:hypothetical protein [Ochrobactrum sp. S45]MBK0042306.1 hypothetical protein [Ochrobactrum sp. S46]